MLRFNLWLSKVDLKLKKKGDYEVFSLLANNYLSSFHFLIFFILLSWLFFAHTLSFDFFIFDDRFYLINSPHLKDLSFLSFLGPWQQSRTPVVFNLWQFITMLFGTENPAPFRLCNVLIHGINSFLVFSIIRSSLSTFYGENRVKNLGPLIFSSLAGAILFLIHPIQMESVIWISSLRGLLSAFFGLLSLHTFFTWRNNQHPGIKYPIYIFLFFMLGMLSKPSIASLPILFIICDIFIYQQRPFKAFIGNLSYLALTTIGFIMHVIHPDTMYQVAKADPFHKRLIIALDSLRVTIINLLFPFNLSFDYELNPTTFLEYFSGNVVNHSWKIIIFFIICWAVIYFFWKRRHPIFFFAVAIFLTFFLVHSGLIPFVFQFISTVANRYAYLPIIGLSLFFAGLVYRFSTNFPQVARLSTFAFLLLLALLGFKESVKWSTSEKILLSGDPKHAQSFALNVGISTAFHAKGDLDLAIKYMIKAKATNPKDKNPYISLLELYSEKGDEVMIQETVKEIDQNFEFLKDELDVGIAEAEFKLMRFSSANYFLERFQDSPDVPTAYAQKAKKLRESLDQVAQNYMPEAYRRIGMMFYQEKEFKTARVWLKMSYDRFPTPKLERFIQFVDYRIKNPNEEPPVYNP